MASKLVVLAGPDEGKIFSLGTETLLLGRSRATETHLTDPHVSRVHCQIIPENKKFVVVDFDSASGTFVNGQEVERHVLAVGDLVRIGATHLQYVEEPDGAPASAPARPAPSKPSEGDWAEKLVGQMLSHYAITATLARGKTGYVFHARDTETDTEIALKVFPPNFAQDEKKVQNFVAAIKAVMPLNHPHLIKIFAAGKASGHCWIAMEYSPAESLAAVIARVEKKGKLDWKGVVRVGVYLARALEFAHQKNLIHQNVTPQNVLVGRRPQNTKLSDLMLASAVEEDPTKPISKEGTPADSLPYMSPERTDGVDGKIDARTDLYSLAATLYAMLSGKPPFQGKTVAELIEKIRLDAPTPLASIDVKAPAPLERLLRHCMAKRSQDRPASAAEVRTVLESLAQEHNIAL